MDSITLTGKADLDIYINPQRQRMLRLLTLAGQPMTPKQLSVAMGISASAAQHHLGKLVTLGVVGLSHTEQVHGITARYYRALPVTVRIGCETADDNAVQRLTLIREGINAVMNGFADYWQRRAEPVGAGAPQSDAPLAGAPAGDALWGVVRLSPSQAQEVLALVRDYLQTHDAAGTEGVAWEYALLAYPAQEEGHA